MYITKSILLVSFVLIDNYVCYMSITVPCFRSAGNTLSFVVLILEQFAVLLYTEGLLRKISSSLC